MKSKVWKCILLVPALITVLSGCGGNSSSKKDQAPTAKIEDTVSHFAGVWGNFNRLTLFRSEFDHDGNFNADDFCQQVLNQPGTYGLVSQYIHSWQVKDNGDILSYYISEGDSNRNRTYQFSLATTPFGTIKDSGWLVQLQPDGIRHMYIIAASGELVDNQFINTSPNPKLVTYLSTTEDELMQYVNAVSSCNYNSRNRAPVKTVKPTIQPAPSQNNGSNSFDDNAS